MAVTDFPTTGTLGTDLLPKRYDITVYRGDSYKFNMVFRDNQNEPVDVTGWTASSQILDTSNLVQTPAVDVSILGDPAGGTFEVDFGKRSSSGTFRYDVEFTLPDGSVRTYIGGVFTVVADITGSGG